MLPLKIRRRKCAKSSTIQPRIVRFRSNLVQSLNKGYSMYYTSSRSMDKVTAWHNVSAANSCKSGTDRLTYSSNSVKIIPELSTWVKYWNGNNAAVDCSIALRLPLHIKLCIFPWPHDRAWGNLAHGEDHEAALEDAGWNKSPRTQGSLFLMLGVLRRIGRRGGLYDPLSVKRKRERERELKFGIKVLTTAQMLIVKRQRSRSQRLWKSQRLPVRLSVQ